MYENIYEFLSFNLALNALIKSKKLNYRRVSEACDIHPSYFSRVMKEGASFSQTQVFKLTNFLELTPEQIDFVFLLWSYQEAQTQKEKSYFKEKISTIQSEKQKVSSRVKSKLIEAEESKTKMTTYYAEAITTVIHMHLTISQYKNNPSLLTSKLGISDSKLKTELQKLKELGLIAYKGNHIHHVELSIHLPAESDLSFGNHINWRLKAIQNIEKRDPQKTDYRFSGVFSADEETKIKARKILTEAIVQIGNLVQNSKNSNEVYHLLLDLF